MDNLDRDDKITLNLAKMEALLISITADGFDGFETMNRELQHNFLITVTDFASETRKLWKDVQLQQ